MLRLFGVELSSHFVAALQYQLLCKLNAFMNIRRSFTVLDLIFE